MLNFDFVMNFESETAHYVMKSLLKDTEYTRVNVETTA
jgi:hypothetical protein